MGSRQSHRADDSSESRTGHRRDALLHQSSHPHSYVCFIDEGGRQRTSRVQQLDELSIPSRWLAIAEEVSGSDAAHLRGRGSRNTGSVGGAGGAALALLISTELRAACSGTARRFGQRVSGKVFLRGDGESLRHSSRAPTPGHTSVVRAIAEKDSRRAEPNPQERVVEQEDPEFPVPAT